MSLTLPFNSSTGWVSSPPGDVFNTMKGGAIDKMSNCLTTNTINAYSFNTDNTLTTATDCGGYTWDVAAARGMQLSWSPPPSSGGANNVSYGWNPGDGITRTISMTTLPQPTTCFLSAIMFMWVSPTNYFEFEILRGIRWSIRRRRGDYFDILAHVVPSSFPTYWDPPATHLMEVRISGANISTYLDGKFLGRVTYDWSTSSSVLGTVGIETGLAVTCRIQSFTIRHLVADSTTCGNMSPPYCADGTIPFVTEPVAAPISSIDSAIACSSCTTGSISSVNNTICTPCVAGRYANLSSCVSCGSYVWSANSSSSCDQFQCRVTSSSSIYGCTSIIIPRTLRINNGGVTTHGVLTHTYAGDTIDFDILPIVGLTSATNIIVTINMSPSPATTTGIAITTWLCPIVLAASNATHIQCVVPSTILPGNLTYTVTIAGVTSSQSTDNFIIPSPTIIAGTLRSLTSEPSTVYTSSTTNGEEIIFNGTNFGTWLTSPLYWQVTYGPNGVGATCQVIIERSNDNEMHCTTVSSSSLSQLSGLIFRVTIGGQSFTGTDVYNYPEVPVITSIRGCTDTVANYSGTSQPIDGTYDCPTIGSTMITISGRKLNSPMAFTIAGKACTPSVVVVEGSIWTCRIPPGVGYRQTVVAS